MREDHGFPSCWCGASQYRNALRGGTWTLVRCAQCAQLRMLPVPRWADQDAGRGEAASAYRVQRAGLWLAFADQCMAQVRRAVPNGRLLDVGCSTGAVVQRAKEEGWDAVGVDVDPAAVAYGREHLGLDLHCAELASLAWPAASFHAITMNHVIEHLEEPLALLAEARRLLAPGGALVLSTPNVASGPARLLGRRWYGLCPDQHVWIFAPHTLRALLSRAGFQPLFHDTRHNMHYEKARGSFGGMVARGILRVCSFVGAGDNLWVAARS